jgi:putative ABC transport system permease protein
MNYLLQLYAMVRMNFRTFSARVKPALVILFGVVVVVCILLPLLSAIEGFRIAYLRSGDSDHVIFMRSGTNNEQVSSVPAAWIPVIQRTAGIETSSGGSPLVDPQIYTPVSLYKNNGDIGYTSLRGIGRYGTQMISHFKLLSGRTPRPGSHEMLVGKAAQDKFARLEIGNSVGLQSRNWVVVGIFSTAAFTEGDLLVPVETLRKDRPEHDYTSVFATVKRQDGLAQLEYVLRQRHGLPMSVQTTAAYWTSRYEGLPKAPGLLVEFVVSGLIAMGVIVGTMHVMEAALSSRAEEIAILRAIGFAGIPIAVAFIAEVMVLACAGAILGTVIDWTWMNGWAYNGAWGVFRLAITLRLFFLAILWALGVALLGATMPSIRAATIPIRDALDT